MRIAAHVSDPYDGYVVEARIPLAELPRGVDPRRVGFNVVVYDSDTQDRTGQSRIGWSTFPGVQADPYRWGVLELPELPAGSAAPVPPRIPDTAARSVESPASIAQAAEDGTGLGGAPALDEDTLRIDQVRRTRDTVTARLRSRAGRDEHGRLPDGDGDGQGPRRPRGAAARRSRGRRDPPPPGLPRDGGGHRRGRRRSGLSRQAARGA